MTVSTSSASSDQLAQRDDLVTLTVDGVELTVPKGTLIIRAAEQLGVAVPRFCDHPLLDPVAACRMCLIEVEGMPKPQPACAVTCGDGMVVRTQISSTIAAESQRSVMEFLLINHPLDCPVCDKGGECPLQNQAMTNGQEETRFDSPKRTFAKPINLSAQVLLDRERCVSCARCTRFAEQIAGDPLIELLDRSSQQQVGIATGKPFNSYFSGNTIQICPVGALTSAMYRFRSRPFDLVSTPTACEHCASGCAQRTDTRRGTIMRRLAAVDPNVNEEWNCDKGRFAFRYVDAQDRLATPMIREDGALRPASWAEALDATAAGLRANRDKTGVITGGRLSVEDALAYSAFARVALGTNNIDFRARASSQEEEAFLAAHVAGSGLGPTYTDLETAPAVLLVCLEPEDESPILMLRLRKAMREFGTAVYSVSPTASPGLLRMNGKVVPTAPGGEPQALDSMSAAADGPGVMLRAAGSVILVGERASSLPGTLSAVVRLAESTGATVGWVPRRAGERGAVEAGLLPSLLPGGRPVADAAARVDAAAVWGVPSVQESAGLDLPHMLEAAAEGDLTALVFAGVDPTDVPGDAVAAATRATFVVVLDTRRHELADLADVVFPVASSPEKAGTFLNWEGRLRPFDQAIRPTNLMPDARVLSAIANELGVTLNVADLADVRAQLAEFDGWIGARVGSPSVAPPNPPTVAAQQLLLHTWQPLINAGALQQDEPYLAATSRPAEVALSDTDATAMGLADGDLAVVTGDRGALTANVVVADVVTGVVALSGDRARELAGKSGDLVTVTKGGAR